MAVPGEGAKSEREAAPAALAGWLVWKKSLSKELVIALGLLFSLDALTRAFSMR
jgi:hypothetical protein